METKTKSKTARWPRRHFTDEFKAGAVRLVVEEKQWAAFSIECNRSA